MNMLGLIYFIFFMLLSFFFFFIGLYFLMIDYSLIFEWVLLTLNSSNISMVLFFDWMSLLFMSLVMFISSMVIKYSCDYMKDDMNIDRFIILVVMFVVSMMFLIISPNLISILLGWDGLGLVSYCLVIYYQNFKSYNAGMLTGLMNRVGDVALLISIAWLMNYGSWNYVFYLDSLKSDFSMLLVSFMIFIASMTKSAQIPFSSWLPAAMAAPTPVSSLVHSSTLVTAGVYLLIRFSDSLNSNLMFLIMFISTMTMFMAGLSANFEFDFKKIIALSTLSQLGLMISILGLGGSDLAYFHMLSHALFKAMLFMSAGIFIHKINSYQDIRFMGGFLIYFPLSSSFFLVSSLSLSGLPFLTGFYSKDLMVEYLSMNYYNLYIYLIYYLSIGLTMCYSFRLIYYLIFGQMKNYSYLFVLEDDYGMIFSMFPLMILSIFGGSFLMWQIFDIPYFIFMTFTFKIFTFVVVLIGFFLGFLISNFSLSMIYMYNSNFYIFNFIFNMWNLPIISIYSFNLIFLNYGMLNYKIDRGWFEYIGLQNLYFLLMIKSKFNQMIFSNSLKILMLMFIFLMIFMILI